MKIKLDSIPIEVMNPLRKCKLRLYIFNFHIVSTHNLKLLREEQLGKSVVSFDLKLNVGYVLCHCQKDFVSLRQTTSRQN